MCDPTAFIDGSEKLTAIFRHWPSFHDAEVLELKLLRGVGEGDFGPAIIAIIHVWEMTPDTGFDGTFLTRGNVIATLQFRGVGSLELTGFNEQNALFELLISKRTEVESQGSIHVEFQSSYGVSSSFVCSDVSVLSVEPFQAASRHKTDGSG